MTLPLSQQSWPDEDLERLGRCPVCATEERRLLFADLWDNAFRVAPGLWTLWRCEGCESGYLDPRPTPASIGRAYGRYYTHEQPWVSPPPASTLQKLRAALANGYRNRRYGTARQPALAAGHVLARLFPPLARPSDLAFRFLERRPRDGPRPRLLDIGCGAGAFLATAAEAGWDASGLDFDSKAVEGARGRGLDVRLGGLETVADRRDRYDAITLSHVIEHLHDPVAALATICSILKPGGRLVIETPNIDAIGRSLYGPNWRGLEPPRHLVIFNRRGLARTLARSGFEAIRFKRDKPELRGLGLQSARMAAGLDPETPAPGIKEPPRWQRLRSALSRSRAEFLIVTCEKPLTRAVSVPE